MSMVMPYLNFNGKCEEAFRWYGQIFGGKIQHMVKYGAVPDNPQFPVDEGLKDQVMHAQVMLTENGGISGADALWPVEQGNAVHIHVHMESAGRAREVFEALAEGGNVIGAFAVNPPPDDNGASGAVADRYGFTWIISSGS